MTALGNLLIQAMNMIPSEQMEYRTVLNSVVNDIGNIVTSYTEWKPVRGVAESGIPSAFGSKNSIGIQSIDEQGMSWADAIISVWIYGVELHTEKNNTSCDQIKRNGKIYNIRYICDYHGYDNWNQYICQEVIDG